MKADQSSRKTEARVRKWKSWQQQNQDTLEKIFVLTDAIPKIIQQRLSQRGQAEQVTTLLSHPFPRHVPLPLTPAVTYWSFGELICLLNQQCYFQENSE